MAPYELILHHPERPHTEELRQYKSLCDRLLPGLRTHSHLYHLIHLCERSYSLTLAEFGEVIGGATFRLIQAASAPCILLEVLLLAVEQRAGVCGRGHGTRLVNCMKSLLLTLAARRGLAAGLVTQSDCQVDIPGGGAARQFWARQRLRATPQATLLTRALHQWDPANEVYAHAVPMLCWLSPSAPSGSCQAHGSDRAQQQASLAAREHYRHTRHTRRVNVRLRGALTLLPPIEREESAYVSRASQAHTPPPPQRTPPPAPPSSANALSSIVGASSVASAASVASSAPQAPPLPSMVHMLHAVGGKRSHRAFIPPPPPPLCRVCRRRESVDECAGCGDGDGTGGGGGDGGDGGDGGGDGGDGDVLMVDSARECRCCSFRIHERCDAERLRVCAASRAAALASQHEAREAAATLHLGQPAAADPEIEYTCGRCLQLISLGCRPHANGAAADGGEGDAADGAEDGGGKDQRSTGGVGSAPASTPTATAGALPPSDGDNGDLASLSPSAPSMSIRSPDRPSGNLRARASTSAVSDPTSPIASAVANAHARAVARASAVTNGHALQPQH